jgi:cell wall-associated NlpC family hydrolase
MRVRVVLTLALAATAVAAGTVSASPPTIRDKQAEAQQVLGEIDAIDHRLDRVVDQWNGARYHLQRVQQSLQVNEALLHVARRDYVAVQQRLSARVVALYESNAPSSLEVLLGATSLNNLVDRAEAVQVVAKDDQETARAAAETKDTLQRRERTLVRERDYQRRTLARLTSARAEIESSLAERRQLLGSIRSEIAVLQQQERERQARLAAEARARLAAEQRAAAEARRRAAAEQAAREQAAREQALRAPVQTEAQPTVAAPTATVARETAAPPTTTEAAPTVATPPDTTAPAVTTAGATEPAPEATAPPPAAGPGHPEVVSIALRYLGTPYAWGGASPAGFDCSGFVMYVYGQVGIHLPHYSGAQYGYGSPVDRSQLQPGDLVFFDGLAHVGIYIGGGQFVHSPHSGADVEISSLDDGWYGSTYVGARRL